MEEQRKGDKMPMPELNEKRFLALVKNHKLTILRDDGLYRHLRVGIPGQNMESWHIHTWPGYLAMVGDMGDWVFSRLDDMLCFFRSDPGEGLQINPGYWSEKLQAQEREGWSEFSIEAFHERVEEWAIEACNVDSFEEIPEEKRDELDTLLDAGDEYEAVAAQRDFRSDWLDLTDFWDGRYTCQRIRDHYLFACYAIAWTVKLYDEQRPTKQDAPT